MFSHSSAGQVCGDLPVVTRSTRQSRNPGHIRTSRPLIRNNRIRHRHPTRRCNMSKLCEAETVGYINIWVSRYTHRYKSYIGNWQCPQYLLFDPRKCLARGTRLAPILIYWLPRLPSSCRQKEPPFILIRFFVNISTRRRVRPTFKC